jgi:prepilin-type N-terminal cleavage/methylation domain-containing protein
MNKLFKFFTLVEVMIVVAIIAVIATIATPMLLDARRNANEKATIASLRASVADQETYKVDFPTYATLAQLNSTGRLNLEVPKSGYTYSNLIVVPTTDNFAIGATPTFPGSSGRKIYAITRSGAVRTDPAVDAAFAIDKPTGIAAITASALLAVIAAGSEQAGVDNINNNFLDAK